MYDLILKNLQRHVELTEEEFEHFVKKLKVETYAKDQHIVRSGQICYFTSFVNKGLSRLYDINEKGAGKSPWGPQDEIDTLNMMSDESS